jgi:UDP-N-acetylglucosamine 2-epimerase
MNRVLTARIASYHFAPTEDSRANLLREGTPDEAIWVTGNTGIDALLWVAGREWAVEDPAVREALAYPGKVVLVTAHRRENWGEPMGRICRALQSMAAEAPDMRIVFSMHRNPALREQITGALGRVPSVSLIDPPDYAPFVKLMQRADIILTDSGGVQEEAPSLGVPVLVLRNTTERPEGVTAGCATLVGTDVETVLSNWRVLMAATPQASQAGSATPANPYGDGRAAARIAQVLEDRLCR